IKINGALWHGLEFLKFGQMLPKKRRNSLRPFIISQERLQTSTPTIGRIGLHIWTIIRQCNKLMGLQRNVTKVASIWLAINPDLPVTRISQLNGIPQCREFAIPNIEEITKRGGSFSWCLNMNDAICIVRM